MRNSTAVNIADSGLYMHGCVELAPVQAVYEQSNRQPKHVWRRVGKVTTLNQDSTWLNPQIPVEYKCIPKRVP